MVLVVVKALDILEYIARDADRAYSLTEIAEGLNMHQATCVNILQTLVEKSYLEHLGRKKGYRLGPMAYNLTNNLSYSQHLVTAAKEVMESLTARFNETSILGVIRNQKRFIVHLVNSDQDLQVRSRTERSLYETATGRLLLAYLSPRERDSLIANIGLPSSIIWPEADTQAGLEAELSKIQAEGLCVTLSPTHIIGLAVPIRKQKQVVASLSIFLPEIRCSITRQKEIVQSLQLAAQAINERLDA
ncbi:IclR family transcriptional regulator [Spirosoma endbachense]|uniref:Helix-turn-helix domain-containing protein n=1 Tax=Spirosoma endbachense TaxID=2666025 RepID=A0A6P1VZY4_9BACT|nr:IclR family transcriptional regulator [Spirosoma endbachense]QHV98741.1 helix-turn-helix domain-containing protein [Spirosoma endbachense]